jgi:hypothetical protein
LFAWAPALLIIGDFGYDPTEAAAVPSTAAPVARPQVLATRGRTTRMKLNFWQWLGVILLVLGVIVLFRNRIGTSTDDTVQPAGPTTTTTQPG